MAKHPSQPATETAVAPEPAPQQQPAPTTGAIEKAQPAPMPEPRNARERVIRDQMRVAQFLGLPTQMIALVDDRAKRGPPEVYVRKQGLLFMAVRMNGGRAPGYETKWHQQDEKDPKDPHFLAEVIVKPNSDPSTWVNSFGSSARATLREHMLPFAREMAETRATVRALQKFTGCGFSVLLDEETVDRGGTLQEVQVEATVVEEPPAATSKHADRSFYADERDAAVPSTPTPPPLAPQDAPTVKEVERLLAKAGKAGLDALDASLRRNATEGVVDLEPEALRALVDELKALVAAKGA